jgi:hypothetical protein
MSFGIAPGLRNMKNGRLINSINNDFKKIVVTSMRLNP